MKDPKHVTGLATFTENISTYKYEFKEKIKKSLESMNATIIKKAIYYTPIETGDLRDSYVSTVAVRAARYTSAVTVGGTDNKKASNNPKKRPQKPVAYYALYVHEDLSATHAPPTQAKFLERAIREVQGTITATFARNIKGYKSGGDIPKPTIEVETIPVKIEKATGKEKATPIIKKPDHKPHGK